MTTRHDDGELEPTAQTGQQIWQSSPTVWTVVDVDVWTVVDVDVWTVLMWTVLMLMCGLC